MFLINVKNYLSPKKYLLGFAILFLGVFLFTQSATVFAEERSSDIQKAEKTTTSEASSTTSLIDKAVKEVLEPKEKKVEEPKLFDIYAATTERTLGDADAPITIIEYASMTCPHCAKFHSETFADVKKEYIDTGKVYWVFREFPLDKLALKSSMMARCVPPSMFFNLIEVLFVNQSRWIEADEPMKALEKTGRLAGMTPALFEECTKNTELEMHVLKNMQSGQNRWSVSATPTFIFNYGEEKASGALKFQEFKEILDKLLQNTSSK